MSSTSCSVCGAPLHGGSCMRCLLALALEQPSSEEPVTRRVGDYEIEGEIARGGMGVVYRARQLSLHRPVALKMILGGELASEESVRRFHLEAQAAARLRHPNIVSVFEVGECDNEPFIAMELIDGGSLRDRSERDARTTAAIIAKVARALAHAHEHGVLHRDVKPSNILLDAAGEPRLTDFGLAKLTTHESGLTLSRTMLGSPGYMAPEQAAHDEVTTATDVYGLGAVLYEMLASRPPFEGKTAVETLRQVIDNPPRPLPAGVPRDLATICLKCLEKAPAQRYASAREMAEDCERFMRGEIINARPVSRSEFLIRWVKRRPRTAALLGITLLSLIAGVSGVFWQWRKAERATAEQAGALKHLRWQRVDSWLEEGDPARALAFLAAQLRERPDNWRAAMYAMSIVDQNAFPVSAGPEIRPDVKLTRPALLAPAGDWIAAPAEDKTVRAWDVASGRERARIQLASPTSAIAAGSKTALAIACEDGSLALRETVTSIARPITRKIAEPVIALAFSTDGSHLLARCKNHAEAHTIDGASVTFDLDDTSGAVLSSSGRRLFVWSKSTGVVWDAGSGRELLRVTADRSFRGGAISGNGQRIVLIEPPGRARAWDIGSKSELPPLSQSLSSWNSAMLNERGTRVTIAGGKNNLVVFDVGSGVKVSSSMKHRYFLTQLVASADRSRTASLSSDGEVRLWDGETGRLLLSPLALGSLNDGTSIALSADGGTLLTHIPHSASEPARIAAWRSTSTRTPSRHGVAGMSNFDTCRLSPDGRYGCLALLPTPTAYIYELATGRVVLRKEMPGGVYDFQFSPDGQRCYAMTSNGWLCGWSLQTGDELWQPSQQPGKVRPVAINADGTRIIAGHNDGHIRVYDTATGKLVMTLDHPGEIKSLRFAPDHSARFVSSSTDTQAHVWDMNSGRRLQSFIGHTHTILSTAWSPDSALIATASYDSTVRLWDVATGRMIGQPLDHGRWMSHLEFHPDGHTLATACRDGTAHLWDVKTGQPLCEPIQQGDSTEAVRFTADGKALLVRDSNGFRFYDAFTGEATTQHYHEPNSIGTGIDSETTRAIMNRDCTEVFLASSMDDAAHWRIEQPRSPAPDWLSDLLETLAVMRLDSRGATTLVPGQQLEGVKQRITQSSDNDFYASWARRVLGMKPSPAATSK